EGRADQRGRERRALRRRRARRDLLPEPARRVGGRTPTRRAAGGLAASAGWGGVVAVAALVGLGVGFPVGRGADRGGGRTPGKGSASSCHWVAIADDLQQTARMAWKRWIGRGGVQPRPGPVDSLFLAPIALMLVGLALEESPQGDHRCGGRIAS